MLSCGRVKTEHFENGDVIALIHYVLEHVLDLCGSREGSLLVCFLLSKFEHRSLHVETSSCRRGQFRKHSFFGRRYFEIWIKRCIFKNIRVCVDKNKAFRMQARQIPHLGSSGVTEALGALRDFSARGPQLIEHM